MARTRVIGLDLGSRCVRAAEVELRTSGSRRTTRLLRFGEHPVHADAMRDGQVVHQAAVVAALRALWKREGFSSRDVVLGIGNQRVFVRDMNLPTAPLDQLRASLRFGPAQDLLPVPVDECLLDFYPVAVAGDTVHGLLIAAPEETVQANVAAATAAGLRPVRVDLNGFGLLRSLVHGPLRAEVVGIVDIGAAITDMVVVERGVLRMYRTLASGSADLTLAVRQAIGGAEDRAEGVKQTYGIAVGSHVPADLVPGTAALASRSHALVDAIRSSYAHYATASGRPVDRLLLAGRGSQLPGLGQQLSTALGLPAAFATADAHVEMGPRVVDLGGGLLRPVLPVALGLASGTGVAA